MWKGDKMEQNSDVSLISPPTKRQLQPTLKNHDYLLKHSINPELYKKLTSGDFCGKIRNIVYDKIFEV